MQFQATPLRNCYAAKMLRPIWPDNRNNLGCGVDVDDDGDDDDDGVGNDDAF